MLTIYNRHGQVKLTVEPSDSDMHTHEVQGDNVLTLSFVDTEARSIDVGDYVEWEGLRFVAMERNTPMEVSTMEWKYNLQFYGIESMVKRYLILSPSGEPTFALTSPAVEHVRLVVAAINAAMGGETWKVGRVDATDNLVIDYDGTYCDEALRMIAEAADTEWWVEGKTINLTRCEQGEALPLAYGRGLISLEVGQATGAKVYTRLYPVGSSRNIMTATYGAPTLQLPNGQKYVETDEVNEYGIIDHYEREAFAHIYPRRVGTISAVRTEKRSTEGKEFVVFFVKDSAIDFDPNTYEIAGETKRITWQDGSDLAGREFECNYNSVQKEYEIITQWLDDDTTQLPNATLAPKVGDRYILWNIRMPESYIRAAEVELREAVDAYNAQHARDIRVYKGKTDFEYLLRNPIPLRIGQRIRLESDVFFAEGFRESRITKVSQRLNTPTLADIEISDALSQGAMQRITDSVRQVQMQVRRVEAGLPDIIRYADDTPVTDNNILSALRTRKDHLRRNAPDTAQGHITHADGASFGEYVGGLLGSGGRIDKDGHAELQSLAIRQFLEVPELRYNRTSVHIGAAFNSPAVGIIREVQKLTATTGRVVLKLEEGELGTVEQGDLLMGIFHATAEQGGATSDTDDGKLNLTFAGFRTVYFECTSIAADRKSFFYALRPETIAHPFPHMTFASRGNRTKAERRQFVIATRSYTRYMVDVDSWDILPKHIITQLGDLSSLGQPEVSGHGLYSQNAYLTGKFLIPGKNKLVEEVINDVEQQISDNAAYDQFSPDGITWHEPPMLSTDRYIRHRRGDNPWGEAIRFVGEDGTSPFLVIVHSSMGDKFQNGIIETTFTAQVLRGEEDITRRLPQNAFSWKRRGGNDAQDAAWNSLHKAIGHILSITKDDVFRKALFEVEVDTSLILDHDITT